MEIQTCVVQDSLLMYYALLPNASVQVMEGSGEDDYDDSLLRITFKDNFSPSYIRFPRHTVFVNREQQGD